MTSDPATQALETLRLGQLIVIESIPASTAVGGDDITEIVTHLREANIVV